MAGGVGGGLLGEETPGGPGSGGMKPPPSGAEAFKYGPGPGTLGAVRGGLAERRQCGPEGGAVRAVGIVAEAALCAWKWVSALPRMAPPPRRDAPWSPRRGGSGAGVCALLQVAPCAWSRAFRLATLVSSSRLWAGITFWICCPGDGVAWAFNSRLASLAAASLSAFSHFLT